jgi:hypothetical protein
MFTAKDAVSVKKKPQLTNRSSSPHSLDEQFNKEHLPVRFPLASLLKWVFRPGGVD